MVTLTRPSSNTTKSIFPNHLKQLKESGLSEETIRASGIYSEGNALSICSLINCSQGVAKRFGAVLVIPFVDIDGRESYYRIKPDHPRKSGDRVRKYESPKGKPNEVYFPPMLRDRLLRDDQRVIFTEGEKKALKSTQDGFPTIGLVGVCGWKQKNENGLLPSLARIEWQGKEVFIAFDSDIETKPDVQTAEKWLAHYLKCSGAIVKVVRLPADGEKKVGLDDYLIKHGPAKFQDLLNTALDPAELPDVMEMGPAGEADPAIEAKMLLENASINGLPKLRFWSGAWWYWSAGRYSQISNHEVRALVVNHLNRKYCFVTCGVVSNLVEQLKAQSILFSHHIPPKWLIEHEWSSTDIVSTKNQIVHLPSYVASQPFTCTATPAFFTTCAVDYLFQDDQADCPRWKEFLHQLWPDDPQSVQLLQEWFGYLLTPDTRQQKMLLLIGPMRSGKGTISRVARGVVGEGNVCGPTLASLQTNFGLWPLLGKTVAIVSDARLSGRSDQAVITERLLSISGEDAQTIDRKNLEPVTTKLLTRFMIVSNELPRLQDSSGALAGRMLVLRLTKSFYGQEDRTLTDQLQLERNGILRWAIEGWKRLRERGRFLVPDSSVHMQKQIEELSSPISGFVGDHCDVSPAYSVEIKEIFEAWCLWCKENGREHGTTQTFGRDLSALLPEVECKQIRLGAARLRQYAGIKLKG